MTLVPLLAVLSTLAVAPDASSETTSPAVVSQAAPAPYVAPWNLRGVAPSNTVRLDDTTAFANHTTTDVLFLSGSYALNPHFGLQARLGGVGNWPEAGGTGYAFANPSAGGVYALKMGDLRFASYLNLIFPLGQGGGNTPDKLASATVKSGALARSGSDNSVFATNYFTFVPGLDAAWVHGGATLQIEATLFQLLRARGDLVEKDSARTNFTTGALAGYQFLPALAGSLELRYQRWLSTPASVAADPGLRDNLSAAAGLRTAIKVADHVTVKPGLSYTRGLEGALSKNGYNMVQLDLPVAF